MEKKGLHMVTIGLIVRDIKKEKWRYPLKRLDMEKYLGVFSAAINDVCAANNISQAEVARRAGLKPTHLNNILQGVRKLSGYYLMQFFRRGVLKVNDIYDGKAESEREKEYWNTALEAENYSLLNFIAKVREQKKVDVESVLRQMYPDIK